MDFRRLPARFWLARQCEFAFVAVVLFGLVAASASFEPGAVAASLLVVAVVGVGVGWLVIRGRFRSWGYLERDQDFVVTRGLLFRRISVVPYGRMQFIDVTAGPIDRAFGLATVQLHTAAAATDARVPGLLRADAETLRDRLASVGESRATGL